MANIFQKIGSAFGQYGMDNRMPADQFLNLPKGDRRQMQVEGLRKFSEAMNLIGAQQSGDPQRMALAQNQIRQRKIDEQNKEQKQKMDVLIKDTMDKIDASDYDDVTKNNLKLLVRSGEIGQALTVMSPTSKSTATQENYERYVDIMKTGTDEEKAAAKLIFTNSGVKTKKEFLLSIAQSLSKKENYGDTDIQDELNKYSAIYDSLYGKEEVEGKYKVEEIKE